MTLVRGSAWIVRQNGDEVSAEPGRRGHHPRAGAVQGGRRPATPPQVIIHPGQHCTTLDGRSLYEEMSLGVRTWGNAPDGGTMLLTGVYQMEGEISKRLLEALPPLLVQPGGTPAELLGAEMVKDEPGQEAVLDRLLDLLLIATLRAWFATRRRRPPGIGRAAIPSWARPCGCMHNNPAHPWTVASLAAQVGVSRASLARRFTELVGEPPMAFLTDWRLALAADLLREPDETIGSVARKVGYGSPFALSAAFKRVRGVSPHKHRVGAVR